MQNRKAIVLGITGGFGSHMARALVKEGFEVVGICRNPQNAAADLAGKVSLVKGDVTSVPVLSQYVNAGDVLVYGINPKYHEWSDKALRFLEPSVQVCEQKRATLVFPGNVYAYDPKDKLRFNEKDDMNPPTDKGEIRLAMEKRLKRASEQGANVLIMRAGDFIGADAPSTWMSMLIKKRKSGFVLDAPTEIKTLHCWAYLPDLANAAAALLSQAEELEAYNVYNFAGYEMNFEQLAESIEKESSQTVRVKAFPWWALKIASLFSPMIKEVLKMRYLWRQPLLLDDAKLKAQIGDRYRITDLSTALKASGLI